MKKIKAWADKITMVVMARLLALSGMITAFVGAMDFSPLWSMLSTGTDFNWKQLLGIGVGIAGAGITIELAKRSKP